MLYSNDFCDIKIIRYLNNTIFVFKEIKHEIITH